MSSTGTNLPEGWNMAPPEVMWIYRLLLSEDANFKMKGRNRSSREKDPTLGPGWAYTVESTAYLKYLAKHVHEDEISHCVSFAALWSANNKCAKGLRASGVGSFSSIIGIMLLTIIASYDIACQWGRNFWKRARLMPDNLQLPDWSVLVQLHEGRGMNRWGGGRTKLVLVEFGGEIGVCDGPRARGEDTIDDLCGFSNWKKTVGLGTGLLRKMVLAILQAMIHSHAFHSFTTGLWEGHEADLSKWEKMVRDWEKDQDHEDSADPYDYAEVEATTMADVLARIAAEEHARVVSDGASALTVKPGPFLIAGIEIQQEQAALQLEAKRVNRTTIQATTLQRSWTLLLAKVKALHDVQDTYMPGLRTWITQQNPVLPTGSDTKPESIPIYLPSSLPANDRQAVCVFSLMEQEEALRNAQANGALRQLRAGLRTRVFAHRFKRKHLVRYRAALLALRGPGPWEQVLQDLKPTNVHGMNERALNDEEKEENCKARLLAGLPENSTGEEINEVEARSDVMPELAEGLRAYALAQAARERAWELDWCNKWAAVREHAQMVMWNTVVDVTELVPLEVELEEEEEAFEEFDDEDLCNLLF
ncbi:hypothetical protein B0H14DRAFT_3465840 [Mycena olivaceomarginata]|nr:hypothetical protein B0H14DRAFT_3465840 [Mycena olivaceomarginata]